MLDDRRHVRITPGNVAFELLVERVLVLLRVLHDCRLRLLVETSEIAVDRVSTDGDTLIGGEICDLGNESVPHVVCGIFDFADVARLYYVGQFVQIRLDDRIDFVLRNIGLNASALVRVGIHVLARSGQQFLRVRVVLIVNDLCDSSVYALRSVRFVQQFDVHAGQRSRVSTTVHKFSEHVTCAFDRVLSVRIKRELRTRIRKRILYGHSGQIVRLLEEIRHAGSVKNRMPCARDLDEIAADDHDRAADKAADKVHRDAFCDFFLCEGHCLVFGKTGIEVVLHGLFVRRIVPENKTFCE